MSEVIKSKKAVLDKIGASKHFHRQWEDVNKAMGRVLSEAYNPEGTMDDWVASCRAASNEMEKLLALGWSIRHGNTVE